MRAVLTLCLCLATPLAAGVPEAVRDHALPAADRFARAADALAASAEADCTAEALRPAWNEAFDAWLGLAHLRFGPLETESRALTLGFWPDTRGMIPRTLVGLAADGDAAVDDPAAFAEVSIAARGFFGMEQVLYGPDAGYGHDSYACRLAVAQARDIDRMAAGIAADWQDHAALLTSAGAADNDTYLSTREARQAFYTALVTGIAFTADQRLGLPLGSYDDPRPERAEARRSARSLRNAVLSLEALRDLARTLAPGPIPDTDAAFDAALGTASRIDSADLSSVADPARRLRVEQLAQEVRAIGEAAANEIGVPLGVSAGFNASDGD
ncbi:imelysin family protein [Roseivivax isoporae]|uniref:Imelysin-like domain-containing protein n=1 Tax=Roseivivax isoporae LMG 25204 TaxID=1449351 RepID=X7F739_9RHOB|nr:imelysin family protein [Roseivivax isoporae]ETX27921.1 hypothetical protein RISW2_10655 [Roseivivax isoporae LMG 25204]